MRSGNSVIAVVSGFVAALLIAPSAHAVPTFSYTIHSPGPLQVLGSTTPVANAATATSTVGFPEGTFTASTSAAAGPGYLSGSSHATLNLPDGAILSTQGFSQESSDFALDNIVIAGPTGGVVAYTVNINVSGSIGSSISGPGPFFASAAANVRFGTNSSFGGFGGVEIGRVSSTNGSLVEATGLFAGFPINIPGSGATTTPQWTARAGDAISVSLILDTSAVTVESFGSGPGLLDAFADFSHTALFGTTVFNFFDPSTGAPVTGWTANSTDGCIEDNTYTCAPLVAQVAEPEMLIPFGGALAALAGLMMVGQRRRASAMLRRPRTGRLDA